MDTLGMRVDQSMVQTAKTTVGYRPRSPERWS